MKRKVLLTLLGSIMLSLVLSHPLSAQSDEEREEASGDSVVPENRELEGAWRAKSSFQDRRHYLLLIQFRVNGLPNAAFMTASSVSSDLLNSAAILPLRMT